MNLIRNANIKGGLKVFLTFLTKQWRQLGPDDSLLFFFYSDEFYINLKKSINDDFQMGLGVKAICRFHTTVGKIYKFTKKFLSSQFQYLYLNF